VADPCHETSALVPVRREVGTVAVGQSRRKSEPVLPSSSRQPPRFPSNPTTRALEHPPAVRPPRVSDRSAQSLRHRRRRVAAEDERRPPLLARVAARGAVAPREGRIQRDAARQQARDEQPDVRETMLRPRPVKASRTSRGGGPSRLEPRVGHPPTRRTPPRRLGDPTRPGSGRVSPAAPVASPDLTFGDPVPIAIAGRLVANWMIDW
jgi:hypothetical protein